MAIFEETIALTPTKGGGQCISKDALEKADIIVSTTKARVSGLIRIYTDSPVSHAALYVGDGDVIEAIGQGVTRRSLEEALKDDVLAVAYRYPEMTPDIAERIVRYVAAQVDAKSSYTVLGAAASTSFIGCRLLGPRPASFFCSQLVLEGYRKAGVPLTSKPSQCMAPNDLADIAQNRLTYVGHLLGEPSWFPVLNP